jgi:hypothetical protein
MKLVVKHRVLAAVTELLGEPDIQASALVHRHQGRRDVLQHGVVRGEVLARLVERERQDVVVGRPRQEVLNGLA